MQADAFSLCVLHSAYSDVHGEQAIDVNQAMLIPVDGDAIERERPGLAMDSCGVNFL